MKTLTKNILQNIGKLLVKHGGILSFCMVITIIYSHIKNYPFYIGILLGFAAYFFINIGVSSFKFIADECEGKNEEEQPTNNSMYQEQINEEQKQPKRRKIKSLTEELKEPDSVDEEYLQSFLQKCNSIPKEKSTGVVDISSALNSDASFDEETKELLFSNLSGE